MRAIYDCITFFNELDLLELRFHMLDSFVDRFVINECDTTFSGEPKPLFFFDNRDRFKQWDSKITHHVFKDTMGSKWNNWDRDREHKNATMSALAGACDDDIIMYSDADEIPNLTLDLVLALKGGGIPDNHLFMMIQKCYMYYMNVYYEDQWRGTKMSSYKTLKQWSFDQFRDFGSEYHKNNKDCVCKILDGGWHFSFLGSMKDRLYKLESYSHQEFNNAFIKETMENNIHNNKDIFFRSNFTPTVVPVDDTFPWYMRQNIDQYKKYLKES